MDRGEGDLGSHPPQLQKIGVCMFRTEMKNLGRIGIQLYGAERVDIPNRNSINKTPGAEENMKGQVRLLP